MDMLMKLNSLIAFLLLFSSNAFSHGGDDGPSSLEAEFSKLSHIHLPMNYSTHHGLSFGYEIGAKQESGAEENSIELNIHPVFFGGFDKIERLICLEESDSKKVENCPSNSKYLLLENKKWDLGIGGELDIHLSIPGTTVGAGVTYIKGKNYFSLKMLNNKNEIRPKLELPTHYSSAGKWRIGDQLTYMSKGSLIINAFVGYEPIFHVGPEFIHTGIHKITVKKISINIFQVEVGLMRSDALGVEANGVIFNAETSKSKGMAKSLIYEFNINNPNSYLGLNTLFAGRLDLTHKLLLESNGSIILKNLVKNKGKSFSGNFGFPILFFNGGSVGTYASVNNIEEIEDNEIHQHQMYSVAHVKEHFTRGFLSNHLFLNRSLFTTLIKEGHDEESVLSATYSWSFSEDKFSEIKLKEKIQKSLLKLGFKNIPILDFSNNHNGYLKAEINLGLSGAQILHLLNLSNLEKIKLIEQNKIDNKLELRKFLKNHKKLVQQRELVEESYSDKNYLELNKHLNDFLKIFFNSEFHTQGFLTYNSLPVAELKLEGEYIKKYHVKLN